MDKAIGSIFGFTFGILLIVGAAVESMNNTHMKDTTPDDRVFVLDDPGVQERIEEECFNNIRSFTGRIEEIRKCAERIRSRS